MTTFRFWLNGLLLMTFCCCQALAQDGFRDDFSDGDAADGVPITWIPETGTMDVDTTSDSLMLIDDPRFGWSTILADRTRYEDVSIMAQLRLVEGGLVGLVGRWSNSGCYAAGYESDGTITIGQCGVPDTRLAKEFTDLDAFEEDVMVRFDLVGTTLSVWAWRPDDVMPASPLASVEHRGVKSGQVALSVVGSPGSAEFRFVQVTPISPPPGDFNGDRVLDASDIDLLRGDITDRKFDLNEDGVIDQDDRAYWVNSLANTYFGDADLNGEFNSTDFANVFLAGEYEDAIEDNSGWAEGDWDGDGDFTSGDFVTAFLDGGYEQGPRPAAAVPEPSTLWLLLVCGLLLARCDRRSIIR